MNAGSKKITVRVGDELLYAIDEAVAQLNSNPLLSQITRSDFVVAAICEKLSHRKRSKRERINVKALKVEEYRPREFSEEEY